jgi:hypothetical protein
VIEEIWGINKPQSTPEHGFGESGGGSWMENGLEDVSCGLRWKGEVPVGTSVVWFGCLLIGRGINPAINSAKSPTSSFLIWHD